MRSHREDSRAKSSAREECFYLAGVRRWMKAVHAVDILERIFIPLHLQNHWALVVVSVNDQRSDYPSSPLQKRSFAPLLGLVESNAGPALLRRRLTYLDPMEANRRHGARHLRNVQRWLSDLGRDRGLRWNPAGWDSCGRSSHSDAA